MRVLHVKIEEGDEWLVAQGLEEPGIITQGRTFDELIANVRDAAQLFLQASDIHIELLIPANVRTKAKSRASTRKRPASSRKKVA